MNLDTLWYAPIIRHDGDPLHLSFGDRVCNQWVLHHHDILLEGHWPPDPRGSGYQGGNQRLIRHNGTFVGPTEILAEVERRLKKCGYDGVLARMRWAMRLECKELAIVCHKTDEWVEWRTNRALNYISTNKFQKRPLYKHWCGYGNNHQRSKSLIVTPKSNDSPL